MHLIQHKPIREAEKATPTSVFVEKYDWLLRWAMHFTGNDRTLSEDLVQDTFVRLLTSWPRIKDDLTRVEGFLYASLRFAHLRELRRGRRMALRQIDVIEFDDLHQTLKQEKNVDPIELQDKLRHILAYLCWRKRSVKSASVLLLRFFHGYFPEEIARIAIMRQRSTNELLRVAREEVKANLADPSRVEILHEGRMPELPPCRVAVPQDVFEVELREAIFSACSTPCLSADQWRSLYLRVDPQPLSAELLGHLVSCQACLRLVHAIFNFPSHGQGVEGFTSREKQSGSGDRPASAGEVRRSIESGMERFRRYREHHPRALMIVVNEDVVAMRDINSASSDLSVQLGPEKPLGIVEIESEQGIPLLTLYAPSIPPEAPPELQHKVLLSDDRDISLKLSFNGETAVLEMHYEDPHFAAVMEEIGERQPEWIAGKGTAPGIAHQDGGGSTPWYGVRWTRLFAAVARKMMPEFNPMFVTATVLAVTSIVCFFLYYRGGSTIKPQELLSRAVEAQLAPSRAGVAGVVVQTVRIQTAQRRAERTLYRDVQGMRHAREQTLKPEEMQLQVQLASGGVNWDDPLAAASFRDWHDHAQIAQEAVRSAEGGLLTLTATVAAGPIASQSLTVRTSDFHPVDRKIELRNEGTVEIAEVSYGILPWSAVNPDLFEPLPPAVEMDRRHLHAAVLPHLPQALTSADLDLAELSARLVLNRLGLDDSGRVEIHRGADGVHVQGLVDTGEEKAQLRTQLLLVPHVMPNIMTVQEMAATSTPSVSETSVRASSDDSRAPSSLDRYFTEHGLDRKDLFPAAQELVESSFVVKHETEQVSSLLQRYSDNAAMPGAARVALGDLLGQHKTILLAALVREEQALKAAQLYAVARSGDAIGGSQHLREDGERNFALSVELISDTSDAPRPAALIASQLSASIADLRTATLLISSTASLPPSLPGNAGPANKND